MNTGTAAELRRPRDAALAADRLRQMTPTAWLMTAGDDGSSDWCEVGHAEPEPMAPYVAVPLYTQADIDAAVLAERERCAKQCTAIAEKMQASYLRSPSDYIGGCVDGATDCAVEILGNK